MNLVQTTPPHVIDTSDIVVVLSNAPNIETAERIANVLVKEHLAACVHIGAQGVSVYEWNGQHESVREVPLTIKTVASRIQALQQRLMQLHPYEVPECLVLPVLGGISAYIDWVREQTANQ